MKVLLFNGSPKKEGCTYTALSEIARELEKEGIETEIFYAGGTTKGCMGCGYCAKNGVCITDDCVNEAAKKLDEADAVVFGSPVHYAAASGMMTSFLDRLFYSAGKKLAHKPCAVAVSCRRGGSTAAIDQLLKYPGINQMITVNAQYWPMVHGTTPEEVKCDYEGMQAMRTLGRNTAWLLKTMDAAEKAGIKRPENEEKIKTNFIR